MPGFVAGMRETVDRAAGLVGQGGCLPPGWAEVVRELNLGEYQGSELLQFLVREGTLVKIADDVYRHHDALGEARAWVSAYVKERVKSPRVVYATSWAPPGALPCRCLNISTASA